MFSQNFEIEIENGIQNNLFKIVRYFIEFQFFFIYKSSFHTIFLKQIGNSKDDGIKKRAIFISEMSNNVPPPPPPPNFSKQDLSSNTGPSIGVQLSPENMPKLKHVETKVSSIQPQTEPVQEEHLSFKDFKSKLNNILAHQMSSTEDTSQTQPNPQPNVETQNASNVAPHTKDNVPQHSEQSSAPPIPKLDKQPPQRNHFASELNNVIQQKISSQETTTSPSESHNAEGSEAPKKETTQSNGTKPQSKPIERKSTDRHESKHHKQNSNAEKAKPSESHTATTGTKEQQMAIASIQQTQKEKEIGFEIDSIVHDTEDDIKEATRKAKEIIEKATMEAQLEFKKAVEQAKGDPVLAEKVKGKILHASETINYDLDVMKKRTDHSVHKAKKEITNANNEAGEKLDGATNSQASK